MRQHFTVTGSEPNLVPEPGARVEGTALVARRGRLHFLDSGRVPLRGNEELGRFSWARQRIDLGSVDGRAGQLSLFLFEGPDNETPLRVSLNGQRYILPPDRAHQGAHFWRALDLPAGALLDGENTVELSSDNLPLDAWALGVAAARETRGSARSWDQGSSWVDGGFGVDQSLMGDYTIRWWIDAPQQGFAVRTPVMIAEVGTVSIREVSTPAGTTGIEWRAALPSGDTLEWGSWIPFDATVVQGAAAVQARVNLDPNVRLEEVHVDVDGAVTLHPASSVDVTLEPQKGTHLASIRDAYAIPDLIEGATTDLERARRLSSWVHERWIHHSDTSIYAPWHAPTIIAWQEAGSAEGIRAPIGFCVHFAVVLTQIATAAGLRARSVILGQMDDSGGGGHFVAEIWCRELDRWVCFDPDFDYHWSRGGVPAGIADVHEAWRDDQVAELSLTKGTAFTRNPAGGSFPMEHVEGGGYAYFGLPVRQDWLRNPPSRLMHHGAVNYHETDVMWFDGDESLRRRYPFVTDRLDDFRLAPGFDASALSH